MRPGAGRALAHTAPRKPPSALPPPAPPTVRRVEPERRASSVELGRPASRLREVAGFARISTLARPMIQRNPQANQSSWARRAEVSQSQYPPAASTVFAMSQQQNSMYGASVARSSQQSHMLDLAKLSQASSSFDAGERGPNFASRRPQDASQLDSLYSPSSSTSLLYHIYDQIHLPAEQPKQLPVASAKHSTILNPANLFGAHAHPQPAADSHHYTSSPLYPPPQPFAAQLSYAQPQLAGPNLMLDALMRHSSATSGRLASSHHRPLSSGASSTLSAHSVQPPMAYARQLRHPPPAGASKAAAGLASVLQPDADPLGFRSSQAASLHASAPKSQLFADSLNRAAGPRWSSFQRRAKTALADYQTLVRCILLLILLAFSLVFIVKFALSGAPTSNYQQSQVFSAPQGLNPSSTSNSNTYNLPPFIDKGKCSSGSCSASLSVCVCVSVRALASVSTINRSRTLLCSIRRLNWPKVSGNPSSTRLAPSSSPAFLSSKRAASARLANLAAP